MALQVRRAPEMFHRFGHRWQVCGRVNGWPCHVMASTKREAYYRKARMIAGFDAYPRHDGEREIPIITPASFIDSDGVWKA